MMAYTNEQLERINKVCANVAGGWEAHTLKFSSLWFTECKKRRNPLINFNQAEQVRVKGRIDIDWNHNAPCDASYITDCYEALWTGGVYRQGHPSGYLSLCH